jgi:hypothetical protein
MEIKLGNKVRDLVTGYEGIVIARVEYLNGCVQFGVKGQAVNNDTKDSQFIDHEQLEKIDDGITEVVQQRKTGGIIWDRPKSGIGLAKL